MSKVGSGDVVLCALAPHPPLLIPEIGAGHDLGAVRKTTDAMKKLAAMVKDARPEVVVVISPHAPLFEDAVAIHTDDPLSGDFSLFMAGEVGYSFDNDLALAREIAHQADAMGVAAVLLDERERRAYHVDSRLDHGVLVPMHFVVGAGITVPVVVMGMAFLSREKLYMFGTAIARAVETLGRRAVVVASGDMSHRLTRGAPSGYDPRGAEFDARIVELVRAGDVEGILALDNGLVEHAGECGYRSLIMALGTLDGRRFEPEVLSYEGPFGVGYAVAVFRPGERAGERAILERLVARRRKAMLKTREGESALVRLARRAVEEYTRNGRVVDPPEDQPEEMRGRAGVFCSIKKAGQLRGCIGTIHPTRDSIAEEIIRNAIAAATEDPRFVPVEPDELEDLTYSVDVLTPAEQISSIAELDPKVYGVIVKRGARSGLLLPDLEGIDDAREQVAIAKRKAGIAPEEDVELFRFQVKRYT
ncbi:MAG: AmmeMemoRadiSam system protein A [Bacillota bacterium]|nr:AmmeMemoRadiSam system protein A [Bacillota bacterium]